MNKRIFRHFSERDPVLYAFIKKIGYLEPIKKDGPDTYFYRLCTNIIGQQLSDKAGDAIIARFDSLFPNGNPQPEDVVKIPHDAYRSAGMSNAKARYVKNLAEAIMNKTVRLHLLDLLTDEEVINELTKVKGIGPWTAEMFLMFVLDRPDVFSYGDLGLRKGMKKIYGFKREPSKKQVEKIISRWSPYKTYASRILWRSLEI